MSRLPNSFVRPIDCGGRAIAGAPPILVAATVKITALRTDFSLPERRSMKRVFGGLMLLATCWLFVGCSEPDRSIEMPAGEVPKMGEVKSMDTGGAEDKSGVPLPAPPP